MQTMIHLAEQYWLLIVIAILAILVIRFVVNIAAKIVMAAIAVGLVLIFAFHMSPAHVLDIGKNAMSKTTQSLPKDVVPIIESELKNAHYSMQPDGKTYDITTEHLKIEGVKGEPTATIYYNNHAFPIDLRILSKQVQDNITQHINSLSSN